MKPLDYNENWQRGTHDFPFEFHHLEENSPRYVMPYHWHLEYEIIHILDGSLTIHLDEQEFVAGPHDTIFVNSSIVHAATPQNCIYECIVFDMNTFLNQGDPYRKYIQNITNHSLLIYHYFPAVSEKIKQVIGDLFTAMSGQAPGYELNVLGAFYQFWGLIFTGHLYLNDTKQTSKDYKRIHELKNVLELMEKSYTSRITLNQLAAAAHMSPKYFSRFFNEMTHKTPIEYLNYIRIQHACQLIVSANLPVTEAAYQCGFNDLSYFIKIFKKYTGTTPKKYGSR